jgi:hypothetical protein
MSRIELSWDLKRALKVAQMPLAFYTLLYRRQGYTVAQLVEALRYKPEGRGFDSR